MKLSLGVAGIFLARLVFSASGAVEPASGAGDAGRGQVLFRQNCALCHASGLDSHFMTGQGPLLAGVLNRPAASVSGFPYTRAPALSNIKWSPAWLERFLEKPGVLVAGTNMAVEIASPADRRDLIAFLATLQPLMPTAYASYVAALQRRATAGDWQNDQPGARHRIRLEDLPAPYATRSAGNPPKVVPRPQNAALRAPPGFRVSLFSSSLSAPRLLRTAPNGDIFVSETRRGRIRVLRAPDGADTPADVSVFADNLKGPFDIAFYPLGENPSWVYVATINSVVRYPYRNGDLVARGPAEVVIPTLSESTGGHTTRDIVFSLDSRRMFVSVGSGSNVAESMAVKSPAEARHWQAQHVLGAAWGFESNRADILVAAPEGRGMRVYATGLRNAVGLAIQPNSGQLWASTNERDALGDDLVPDYITHVVEGGYYGWPWYYMGSHEDPRHSGERPDLAGKALAPDVPVQAHSASLQMAFYPAKVSGPAAFPASYSGEIFAAFHGSWNRTGRTGSKIVRVHLLKGVATGDYEDFLTGFVIDDGHVWGRPVGITVAHDGALLVTEDGNDTIWRISYSAN